MSGILNVEDGAATDELSHEQQNGAEVAVAPRLAVGRVRAAVGHLTQLLSILVCS